MGNNSFHSKTIEQVLQQFSSGFDGLSEREAKERLEKFNFNEIPEKKSLHPFFVFLKQFHSWLIYILIGAAVFSYFTGHIFDVYIIFAVLLFNAAMGFIQEYKAEKAIQALKKMVVDFTKVIRDGNLLNIPVRELVPGDIILLEEGDRVPADARLLEVKNFQTMEAALTGESETVSKDIKELPGEVSLADQKNMVWMGTFVTSGHTKAIVVSTGLETALSKIAENLKKIKVPKTHFKIITDLIGKQMGIISIIGAILVFLIGYFLRNLEVVETFRFAVAALVSAIPEGLPVILVIVLAVGAHRMAKRNAIIRNLPATETLSIANIIATDKTGTLTQNTMNIEKIFLFNQEEITVSGEGWKPKGNFMQKDKNIFPLENKQLRKLLHIAGTCNDVRLIREEGSRDNYKIIGDPTEGALVVLAEKAGLKQEALLNIEKKIDDFSFSSKLKYRASLLASGLNGKKEKQIYLVGAPEVILEISNKKLTDKEEIFSEKEKKELFKKINSFANQGLRVLGLAYKPNVKENESLDEKSIKNLVFVGIVGMKDPVRFGVKEAIAKTKAAGIRVIMKTGDHKETALAIAKEVGMTDNDLVLTESELENLTEQEFGEAVRNVSIFARLTPQMKLRILEKLQDQGNIVAMTGDGVNDTLALKRANIGISMGQIGTDVARESSDMVLVDDNFASIVNAIEEGRTVFTNTKQASLFLITTSLAEIITLLVSLLLGVYFWGENLLIILPATVLFLNLVTNGFMDVALAVEPRHEDVFKKIPNKEENILSKDALPFIGLMVVIMTVFTVLIFKYFLIIDSLEKARAGAFLVMASTQLFNVLNMRSLKKSIFDIGFFSNQLVSWTLAISFGLTIIVNFVISISERFGFKPLSVYEFLFIIFISSFVLWIGELYKYWLQKRKLLNN